MTWLGTRRRKLADRLPDRVKSGFFASDVTATEQVREAFANLSERHNTRISKDTGKCHHRLM
jgi:hypothetical protein